MLAIGQGGLSDWHVLTDWPWSLAALLLLANVGIYVPLGFFIALGWPSRMRAAVVAAVTLAVTVESIQFLLLDRVASTDDVLLNTAGAAVGFVIGRGRRVRFHQHRDAGREHPVRR